MRVNNISANYNINNMCINKQKAENKNAKSYTSNAIFFAGNTSVEIASILLQKKAELKEKGLSLQKEAQTQQIKAKEIGDKYQALADELQNKIADNRNNNQKPNRVGFRYFNEYQDGKIFRQTEYQIIEGKIALRNITELLPNGKRNGINFDKENKVLYMTLGYSFPAPDAYKDECYIKFKNGNPIQIRTKSESDSLGGYSYTEKEFLYDENGVYQINQELRADIPYFKSIEYRYNYENGILKTIDEKLQGEKFFSDKKDYEPLRTYKY